MKLKNNRNLYNGKEDPMARDVCGETLWLSQPAGRWLDAFPIGNGRLGAMVLGGTEIERLALNHENLWRGATRYRTTQPRHQHLAEIRERFFAREWIEGTELTVKYLCDWPYPVPSGVDLFLKTLGPDKHKEELVQPYQAFGDMTLDLGHVEVSDYRRSLALNTGIAEVRYEVGGVSYRREVFASAEHHVIVLHLTANTLGAIGLTVKLDRIADPACALRPWSSHDRLGFEGHFDEGIDFAAEARVAASGGETSTGAGASLHIRGADAVLIVLTMAVDYDQAEPAAWCTRHLDGVPMDVGTLRAAHLAEHSAMYERVALDLAGKTEVESLPLDARLRRLRAGGGDPSLFALYFQYGRYLLMSCSRRCDQPATLQGLWNERIDFREWGSSYVVDMNLEMNYWPAEVCNLSECAEPLFSYLERFIPQGSKAARDLYDCRGIVLPQTADVWARPTGYRLGAVWPSAAAWLAEHYWWRYEYTLDTDFLRGRAYPFLKLVAEFYEDYLVRDPEHGWLVTVPSISPENSFVGGTHLHSICVAPTMDLILIREALTHCLQASEILGCDAELRPTWEAILDDLPPYQIGSHGQLQEWLEDFDEEEPGHRHMAHLIGVYPGEEMTPGAGADDLCQAARVSLERRLTADGGHTGWSRAWVVAL